jgi:hypothetical protein
MPFIPKGSSWVGGWTREKEYQNTFGIGLVAGSASGGLECIDFDNHFGDAKEVISEFYKIEGIREIVEKHKLPIESTTSGGFHLMYRCSVIEGNQKLASRPKKDEATGKVGSDILIETRGERGYFVVAPTPGYRIIKNDIMNINIISPDERDFLLSACRTFNKSVRILNKAEEEKDRAGDIFNRTAGAFDELVKALKDGGWTELKDGIWRRPGKKNGISATLGRVAPGIFYNFSSSASPFESDRAYTPFHVVSLLKYDGDFKRFAKELYERYYPKRGESSQLEPQQEAKQAAKTENQLDSIITKAFINLEIPVAKPPVIIRIKSRHGSDYFYNRVFTLGNFSAITGKSKAKKTFLTSFFLTTATINGYYGKIFQGEIPSSKPGVVLFDTEQSPYDAYITAKRVWDMADGVWPNFGAFDLREFNAHERCNIIERYLAKGGDQTSYIVIDGIADLATAINDEIEASRVVSLLMRWTKIYNIHISVVIHQNKNDNYATGHLGSAILKKAECIISVTKDPDDNLRSEVTCDMIRGTSEFDMFSFSINEKGLPEVEFTNSIQQLGSPFVKII